MQKMQGPRRYVVSYNQAGSALTVGQRSCPFAVRIGHTNRVAGSAERADREDVTNLASPEKDKKMTRNVGQNGLRDTRGFTVVELAIALSSMAVLTAVALGSFRQYAESMSARKAAVQFAADVGLTRSFAIQRRQDVSLVVDESALTYVVRDASGTVLMRRDFSGTDVDLTLTQLTMNTTGDSLTFNSRGLLSTGTAQATLARRDRSHQVAVNGLGRTTLN